MEFVPFLLQSLTEYYYSYAELTAVISNMQGVDK